MCFSLVYVKPFEIVLLFNLIYFHLVLACFPPFPGWKAAGFETSLMGAKNPDVR